MRSHHVASALVLALVAPLGGIAAAAEPPRFGFSFEWGDIPSCTDGQPNTVPNPVFHLRAVPVGTRRIDFVMTDLDVPDYDHGGAVVAYHGQSDIVPGVFEYASPCPPNGTHTYEWSAVARDGAGNALATGSATAGYPP